MSRNEKERLRDIKDAIAAIRQHLEQAIDGLLNNPREPSTPELPSEPD